jgi:hypothetical protein
MTESDREILNRTISSMQEDLHALLILLPLMPEEGQSSLRKALQPLYQTINDMKLAFLHEASGDDPLSTPLVIVLHDSARNLEDLAERLRLLADLVPEEHQGEFQTEISAVVGLASQLRRLPNSNTAGRLNNTSGTTGRFFCPDRLYGAKDVIESIFQIIKRGDVFLR